jgi:hypothetical protein
MFIFDAYLTTYFKPDDDYWFFSTKMIQILNIKKKLKATDAL